MRVTHWCLKIGNNVQINNRAEEYPCPFHIMIPLKVKFFGFPDHLVLPYSTRVCEGINSPPEKKKI